MRLSISLTLSLFSATHLSATASKISARQRMRMLQKAEAASAPTNHRALNNGRGIGIGGGPDNARGGGSDKISGSGSGGPSMGGNNGKGHSYYGHGITIEKPHSANLDTNDSGVTTDKTEYNYDEPVYISFDLKNEHVPTDVLAVLAGQDMAEWKMGVFMRMADPQDGALLPIKSAVPTFVDQGGSTGGGGKGGERSLQQSTAVPPAGVDGDETTQATEPPAPEEVPPPPTLNYKGTATLTADQTSAAILDESKFGTGFDVFLLDDSGRAIIGPAAFYMIKTETMVEEEEARQNLVPNHPLARFDHSKKTKHNYGNGGGVSSGKGGGKNMNGISIAQKIEVKEIGQGTGKDGGMIIATASSLAEYTLETDKLEYGLNEDVTVTYNLNPNANSVYRRLQRGNVGGGGTGVGGSLGNGNGNGGSNGKGNDLLTTTSSSANPASTTTTTTTEATVDQGAGDGDIDIDGDMNPEEPEDIDPEDKTLFSMGVYMRMAHPQDGALAPILDVPFCSDAASCARNVEDLEAGEFVIKTADLDSSIGGFDLWILNGNGHGVAGPQTFYISSEA